MNREQIMQVIRDLAKSQGCYCRLLQNIQELQALQPERVDEFFTELEAQKLNDAIDLILYFEQ